MTIAKKQELTIEGSKIKFLRCVKNALISATLGKKTGAEMFNMIDGCKGSKRQWKGHLQRM